MRKLIPIFALAMFLLSAITFNSKANVNNQSDPNGETTVSFQFDGLMAFCFGNPNRASIGILDVPHHTPELTVTRVKGENRTRIAVLKGEQLKGTFTVDIAEGGAAAVTRYLSNSMENDRKDFRWTIDMESDIYQRRLYLKEDKLAGKIHFNTGQFYANNLSEKPIKFYSQNGQASPFNRRAAEPAARMNLAINDTLVIKGEQEEIRLKAEPGVKYEVTMFNLPPADMASMDHFLFYYDAIGANVPKYTPIMVKESAFGPSPLVCIPLVFSKSTLN